MKSFIRILFLIVFEMIGYWLYKNLNVEDIWKYTFAYIYGGIIMAIYLVLSIKKIKSKED